MTSGVVKVIRDISGAKLNHSSMVGAVVDPLLLWRRLFECSVGSSVGFWGEVVVL